MSSLKTLKFYSQKFSGVEKSDFSLEQRGEDTAIVPKAAFKDFQCK